MYPRVPAPRGAALQAARAVAGSTITALEAAPAPALHRCYTELAWNREQSCQAGGSSLAARMSGVSPLLAVLSWELCRSASLQGSRLLPLQLCPLLLGPTSLPGAACPEVPGQHAL